MALWKNMLMWRQNLHVMFTFVLILYMRILLEAHAGSDVCSICQCDFGGVLRIHCDHRNLTSVPENILQNVRILKLSDNKISKIERGSFENLPSLKILNMSNNLISIIECGSFENLTRLEELYLDHNFITNIEHESFYSLINLKELLEKSTVVFTIYCTTLIGSTKDQVSQNLYKILNTPQTLRNLRINQVKVTSKGEMFCNEDTSTYNGTFNWPMTKFFQNGSIQEMTTSQYMTLRKCSPFTGIWLKPNMSQCFNTEWITRQLKNITSEDIDKGNVEEFSAKLLNISQQSAYFREEDIDLAVDTLEKMVPLTSNVSVNITLNNVLPSINNMINITEEILTVAEQSDRSVNK
eukprot:XP_014782533.1 PREDICTED: uncharacterized protein LOC106877970 [Octopus bimaculoides]